MPLEIREIGIRMRVGESTGATVPVPEEERDARTRDAIVEECVRRVMALLRTRRER